MGNNKSIAKNAAFLYIRMFLIMGVSLYTSRIVLEALGVIDYGIYSVVGGVVALFGFLNAAMSSATQRYLSFDIGKNQYHKLQKTFNTTVVIHVGIALMILLFAETIGLWYVKTQLNVPQERMTAAFWVYHFSVFTSIIGVLQVPFNSLIIAKERMNVFAVVSILDVLLKLLIVYFLLIVHYDKLILYSVLVCCLTLVIALSYRLYCYHHFPESKFKFFKDKSYYKELLAYSGWNLFGNIAAVSKSQGINLLLNAFFGTILNAAYGIMVQVQSALLLFVNNFQLAVNPQIIKTYSQGNLEQSRKLIFQSSKLSFFLILIIAVPLFLNTQYILELWLKTPPSYTFIFVQLCMIDILIDSLSRPLITGAQATGKIKIYQIVMGSFILLNLPLAYVTLRFLDKPEYIFYISIAITLLSLIFRLFFLKSMIGLSVSLFFSEVMFRVGLVSLVIYILFNYFFFNFESEWGFILFLVYCMTVVLLSINVIFFIGLRRNERKFLIGLVKSKIMKR